MQESFTIPRGFKAGCYILSALMLGIAVTSIFLEKESQGFIFFSLPFFFLSWSMYAYTRLQLVLDNQMVVFTGGFKPHRFSWGDITRIDMAKVGKYSDPQVTIYYSDRKLQLARSFYRKKPFLEILHQLEKYAPAAVFTAQYRQLSQTLHA
ncbi:hypothetical protein [Chitinophaga flava]|uniref:Uncharacterized protein n=1 Tax=Chitinophaga flava TaxID=2259036 RepID=A0A365XZ99_9BACT|nr:hypothetical protein [Chitinophaga flava]RBL91677.1 hypothetical protein DF182_03430 [Chitinophaga flava]